VRAIEALLPELQKEVRAAEKAGPVQLARAFVVMHRLQKRMLSDEESFKEFKAWHREVKEHLVPQCFDQAGIDHVPLSEGYRVGTSEAWRASIKPDQKVGAYAWLESNEKGDIITATVNASTLSALAKQMAEANQELPEEFFNCAQIPSTSVTAIKK
jgi:hypothetical protein